MPTDNFNKTEHPNIKARVLPHNEEAEKSVLGCVLISEDAALTILNDLKSDDFYIKAHRELFDAMQTLMQRDRPIDYVTLVQELEERGTMEKVGGITYVTQLTTFVPTAENHPHYVDIVKKTSKLRKLIYASQKIMDTAYSGDGAESAMNLAESEIYELGENADKGSMVSIQDAIVQAVDTMEKRQRNPIDNTTVPMPFEKLQEMMGGFHRSDLVIIAARPAQGKTSLGMNFISHAALDKSRRTDAGKVDPFKCAVFSLEMQAEQLATRLLCSVAKVSMKNVKAGTCTRQEMLRLGEAQNRLKNTMIYIDDNSMTTPLEILSKCRRLKREKGLDMVLIDYLQLMNSGKRVESRQQEISDITRTMKIAAKELDVPIILLCQMSRDIEKRTGSDKRPKMSDLRESGAIEQDADIIIFLYRECDPNDMTVDEDKRTKCDLIVAKHRNGETGDVTVRWHGEYTTFTDLYEKRTVEAPEEHKIQFVNHSDEQFAAPTSDDVPPTAPIDAYDEPKKAAKSQATRTVEPTPEPDVPSADDFDAPPPFDAPPIADDYSAPIQTEAKKLDSLPDPFADDDFAPPVLPGKKD